MTAAANRFDVSSDDTVLPFNKDGGKAQAP